MFSHGRELGAYLVGTAPHLRPPPPGRPRVERVAGTKTEVCKHCPTLTRATRPTPFFLPKLLGLLALVLDGD